MVGSKRALANGDPQGVMGDKEKQFLDALKELFLSEEFADVSGNFQIAFRLEQMLDAQPVGGEVVLDVGVDDDDCAASQWVMHKVIPVGERTSGRSFLCVYCKQGNPPKVVCCSKAYAVR